MEKPLEPFEVRPYSLDALIELAAKLSVHNDVGAIKAKSQPSYLHDYLEHSKAATIVVERHYVDRDYLEDFAAYYVKCFEPYARCCSRIHFFTKKFDEKQLKEILSSSPISARMQEFQDSYIGFTVIKPLPKTVFGRTCLRTYPTTANRHFPVARDFQANLFGVALRIPETLPFQEQDNVVSACATSALWSALQGTAKEFHHRLWTPIEITEAATEFSSAESRMIPNRAGLSTAMMADAIRSVGLEPLLLDIPQNDEDALRASLYAYLRARIPVIMGIGLIDTCKRKPSLMGWHAIAVTGYNLSGKPAKAARETGFRQRATTIDKIYAHDDQLGPFARMEFDGITVKQEVDGSTKKVSLKSLSTSWLSSDGKKKVRGIPSILLVPLYHKIRIPFVDVFSAIVQLDGFFKTLRLPPQQDVTKVEWDIHLSTVNDLKADLQSTKGLTRARRVHWLTKPMPRFLWRATAYARDARLFDVLFDATDIHTSSGDHGVVFYDQPLGQVVAYIARQQAVYRLPDLGAGARRILRSIAEDNSP